MKVIEEILRLKSIGHNKAQVARLLKINRETVIKFWEGPLDDDDSYSQIPLWVKELDWDYINKEINSKVPKKILYEELSESVKLPSYQAFCQYLRNQKIERPKDITIKQHRSPGSSIEVDYSGDSVQILNPATGELYRVELFVGSLSYSGYFYAEFTFSQRLEDFIRSHINMFSFFGGVSDFIIPDNCKTAVIKTHKTDPKINSTYQDMCKHYKIVVDPADPRSPRHKPNVENAVKYVQTDFMSRIRKKTFTSLTELNQELHDWLKLANQKVIQGRGESRRFFFDKEKELLKDLPPISYDLFYFKKGKVHPDCHIQYSKNYYSVPYQYVGKEVDIKFNEKMIHVYFNCERIATHKVLKGSHHYATSYAHYPEKKYIEVNYHLALAKKEALKVGEYTSAVVCKLINESKHPLKVLRKIQGIINLTKKFTKEEMEYGCELALEFNKLNYDHIKRFSKNFYKKPNTALDTAPIRQQELICLQGGAND